MAAGHGAALPGAAHPAAAGRARPPAKTPPGGGVAAAAAAPPGAEPGETDRRVAATTAGKLRVCYCDDGLPQWLKRKKNNNKGDEKHMVQPRRGALQPERVFGGTRGGEEEEDDP